MEYANFLTRKSDKNMFWGDFSVHKGHKENHQLDGEKYAGCKTSEKKKEKVPSGSPRERDKAAFPIRHTWRIQKREMPNGRE